MRTQRGYTLLEIMIVIGIIAVLAAVSVPLYRGYQERAQAAEIVVLYDSLRSGLRADLEDGPWEYCSDLQDRVGGARIIADHYALVSVGMHAAQGGGGYNPVMQVLARMDREGEQAVKVAKAAYETLAANDRVIPSGLVSDIFVSFSARLSDSAGPDCLNVVTVPPPTPSVTAPPQAPPQAAVPPPQLTAVEPDKFDLGWYTDLGTLDRSQTLDWAMKYMYAVGVPRDMVDSHYPGDALQQTAQTFQTNHTPAVAPVSVPDPIPQKIPPLTQAQQNSVDSMTHDQLVEWALQNLYHGNEAMRSLVERIYESDLRRIIRQQQQ